MTAPHLRPEACYVCGGSEHPDTTAAGGHAYWSNAAAAHFAAEDRRLVPAPTWADGVFAEERPWPEVAAE